MYQSREMRQGRSSVPVLLKVMFLLRSVGREPGRWLSLYGRSSESEQASSPSARRRLGLLSDGIGWIAVASLGWEMLFWPTMTEPSTREADMWWENVEFIAGITRTSSVGTEQMLPSRYMALSRLPLKRRAPVKNRLPTLAEVKSNVEDGGLARLRISMLRRFKKERISSLFAGDIASHKGDVPSTMEYHSACAVLTDGAKRWLKNVLSAALSECGGHSGIRRTSLPIKFYIRQKDTLRYGLYRYVRLPS